jgi:transposase
MQDACPGRNISWSTRLSDSCRTLTLTRKNALFTGVDGGAEHWAVIASVIEICKLIGVEPYAHFPDVITRIADGLSQSRLEEHLPCA